MRTEKPVTRATCALSGVALLLGSLPLANAADSHLCTDVGGVSPCTVPATTFVSGTGASSATLSGNPTGDNVIVDPGQTAQMPDQTYYNFGTIRNQGTFYTGNPDGSSGFSTWLRVMGPGSLLENYGVMNNLTVVYIQDNSVLGTNAPSGSGSFHNHAGAVFNNGSSQTYSDGSYYYGGMDGWDAAGFTNDGTFNNYSEFFMGDPGVSTFTNNGTLHNFAPLNTYFGAADISLNGVVTNTGTLHNHAGAALEISGVFNNTSTGHVISEGYLETNNYGANSGQISNAGTIEIKATGTAKGPNYYAPSTFTQSTGLLSVDGRFAESLFDIQGGTVTGGGVLDTTHSNVPGTAPTFHIGPNGTLSPGNGTDNEFVVIGDGQLDGNLIIELMGGGDGGAGQGTQYDFLHFMADGTNHTSTGYLQLGGDLTVHLLGGFMPSVGNWFDIATADGGIGGNFLTPMIFDVGGYTFERDVIGNTLRLTVIGQVSAVPIPGSVWLLGSGFAALLRLRRRKVETTKA